MSNELAYIPFFVSDFLVAVASWPPDRIGAYTLALFYQFENGGVPADDEAELARILHASRSTTRRLWSEIRLKFHRHGDDGLWRNERMLIVVTEARRHAEAEHARANKGARARWGKGANSNAQASTEALPEQYQGKCLSNANQNQNQSTYPPLASRREAAVLTSETRDALEKILNALPEETRENARVFHDAITDALSVLGWSVTREVRIPDRGDGMAGYLDIVVTSPVQVALELDYKKPRQKSVTKLRCASKEGFAGVVICRVARHPHWTTDGDIAVWMDTAPTGRNQRQPDPEWAEQHRKTVLVKQYIAEGMNRTDAMRKAGFR